MSGRIRIALADDHLMFRQGVRSVLATRDDVAIVAETDQVDGILPMLDAAPCDLLLLDLRMDRNSLIEIEALAQRIKVIVLTASENPDELLAAVRAGARAVVFKQFAVEQLTDAIRAVANDQVWLPASLQGRLVSSTFEVDESALTSREREIVRSVALGLRNAEVGRRLFISELTVKTHLNNIFRKVGVRDRVELTLYAVRTGLVGAHERRS